MKLISKIYSATHQEIEPIVKEAKSGDCYKYTLQDPANNRELGWMEIDKNPSWSADPDGLVISQLYNNTINSKEPYKGIGTALFEIAFRKSIELGQEGRLSVSAGYAAHLFHYNNGFTVAKTQGTCLNYSLGKLVPETHSNECFTYAAYESWKKENEDETLESENELASNFGHAEEVDEGIAFEDDEELDFEGYLIDEDTSKQHNLTSILGYYSFLEKNAGCEEARKAIREHLRSLGGVELKLSDKNIQEKKKLFNLTDEKDEEKPTSLVVSNSNYANCTAVFWKTRNENLVASTNESNSKLHPSGQF